MNSHAPVDRRIRKTREALRAALQDLLLEKPFEQITIRDIVDLADIAYTTFFRHFPDKDALLSDLADAQLANLLDASLPLFTPTDSHTSTLALCELVHGRQALWTALLTGGAAGAIREQFKQQVAERQDEWPAVIAFMPPEVGTSVLCGVTLDVLTWWLGTAPETPCEEVATLLDRFFAVVTTGSQGRASARSAIT